jgi:two-component system sensor histidine kinase DegS
MTADKIIATSELEQTRDRLDKVFQEISEKLEQGRDNIFQIAEVCQKNMRLIRTRLEETIVRTALVIKRVDDAEKQEKLAREKLLVVSSNFQQFTEADIKECYAAAQNCQIELAALRQEELQLRQQREDLLRQLRQTEAIAAKADDFLQSSSMAVNVLQGNLSRVADLADVAMQKEQLGMWMLENMELERRKMARELHDGPAQTMAGILIRLDLLGYLQQEDQITAEETTREIRMMGQECLNDIRRLMFDLKPNIVQNSGLLGTLTDYFIHYGKRYDFKVDFTSQGKVPQLSPPLEVAVFRMIQEAITNIRKHAEVGQAEVKLKFSGKQLLITITDHGKGFLVEQYEQKIESYGIISMKERAELLGGDIAISSKPGKGTKVTIRIPV